MTVGGWPLPAETPGPAVSVEPGSYAWVVAQRAAGATWPQIARATGVPAGEAHRRWGRWTPRCRPGSPAALERAVAEAAGATLGRRRGGHCARARAARRARRHGDRRRRLGQRRRGVGLPARRRAAGAERSFHPLWFAGRGRGRGRRSGGDVGVGHLEVSEAQRVLLLESKWFVVALEHRDKQGQREERVGAELEELHVVV